MYIKESLCHLCEIFISEFNLHFFSFTYRIFDVFVVQTIYIFLCVKKIIPPSKAHRAFPKGMVNQFLMSLTTLIKHLSLWV